MAPGGKDRPRALPQAAARHEQKTSTRRVLAFCSYLDQLVVAGAEADLLAVLQTAAPIRVGMDALEVVVGVLMILRAVRRFAAECAAGERKPEELNESLFSTYLDSAGIPDPELIIRPSGEQRLSNFLLWQCAYSEFYYTDALWPDFDEAELDKAIAAYQSRDRRFGGVKK